LKFSEKPRTVELTIVIVNWNAGDLLSKCVESIWRHAPQVAYEVVVVDNASADDSLALLRAAVNRHEMGKGQVRVIENVQNLGFAKANNQAFHDSVAPLLMLLNPDTEVKAGAFDRLLTLMRSDERIGACAPRITSFNGALEPNAWRLPPTFWSILCDGLGLYLLLPSAWRARWLLGRHWEHTERRAVPGFCGAAMMVRRKTIEAVGGLDESFEMFGEDCEWCVRMGRGGWTLYLEPGAEVLHHSGQSALKRWTPDVRRLREVEGYIRFQQRVLSSSAFVFNQLAQASVAAALIFWRLLRGYQSELLRSVCGMHLRYFRTELASWFGGRNAQKEEFR